MVHNGTSSSYGHSTVSGFELALCSSPSSRCRCIFDRRGTVYITIFLVTFFPLLVLPFSELSLVRLALDRRLTNHCFSVLEGGISSAVLLRRLDLGGVTAVLRAWRLGWCGRVRRAASCIGSVARLGLPGAGGRGGPGRTWSACVGDDVTLCGLDGVGPLGGGSWRAGVRRCQVLPTPESRTTAAP